MKSILEYLANKFIDNDFLITESFKCTYLKEISKQFNDRIKMNHEENSKSIINSNDTASTFKYVFSGEPIDWYNITDDMFKKYTKDNDEGVSKAKAIMANRKNHFDGIVILLSDDEPKYRGMFVSLGGNQRYYSFISTWHISYDNIRPSEMENYLTKEFLIADVTKLKTYDKRWERQKAQAGTLVLHNTADQREYEYKEIAKKNVEKYKQYVAKVKAQKDMNDGMSEKVMEYVNKIMQITTKFSLDPVKYAKYEYEVGYLLDSISDKRTYTYDRRGGHSSGSDGLLAVYKEYIKTKLSLAKGDSYGYERDTYNATKKKLNDIFVKLDEKIAKFNEE